MEEEHADVEYQIRCLMLQPEANKTDFDKGREEALINRYLLLLLSLSSHYYYYIIVNLSKG